LVGLSLLTNKVLEQGDGPVERASKLGAGKDLTFDGVKLVGLDTFHQVTYLRTFVDAGIAMQDKTVQDQMLLLVQVHELFEVPASVSFHHCRQ